MNNEIIKANEIKLNSDGNQIISEKSSGAGKEQVVKYGLIKLIGEKQEHKVSFKTLLAISKAKDEELKTIMIRELNMVVDLNQIIMLRSDTEKVSVVEDFTKLPTANLCLDLNLKPLNMLRSQLLREQKPYYEATVHYTEYNGERQYYLTFDKIKRCLKIDYDEDGYDFITKIYEYGVEKTLSNAK